MKIHLVNKPIHLNTEYLIDSISFFAEKLLSKNSINKIKLTIKFKSNFIKNHGLEAECIWEDDNYRPKEFTIHLDSKLSERKIIQALAHEMTHVKQYTKNEVFDFIKTSNIIKWKGKKFDIDKIDYWECPWEIEAYGYEKCLYQLFKIHCKKNKISK
jgi:hypothetical protein